MMKVCLSIKKRETDTSHTLKLVEIRLQSKFLNTELMSATLMDGASFTQTAGE